MNPLATHGKTFGTGSSNPETPHPTAPQGSPETWTHESLGSLFKRSVDGKWDLGMLEVALEMHADAWEVARRRLEALETAANNAAFVLAHRPGDITIGRAAMIALDHLRSAGASFGKVAALAAGEEGLWPTP